QRSHIRPSSAPPPPSEPNPKPSTPCRRNHHAAHTEKTQPHLSRRWPNPCPARKQSRHPNSQSPTTGPSGNPLKTNAPQPSNEPPSTSQPSPEPSSTTRPDTNVKS